MKRRKVPKRQSKKLFRKTAHMTHKKNLAPPAMRGGISI